MLNILLDTNIVVDFYEGGILFALNTSLFSVSNIVLNEEILKQIKNFSFDKIQIIKEEYLELMEANKLQTVDKGVSFIDALNVAIAKERSMCLATGDQKLKKVAESLKVQCFGTIKLIEILIEEKLLTISEGVNCLNELKNNSKRRLPKDLIEKTIDQINKKEKILI